MLELSNIVSGLLMLVSIVLYIDLSSAKRSTQRKEDYIGIKKIYRLVKIMLVLSIILTALLSKFYTLEKNKETDVQNNLDVSYIGIVELVDMEE